MVSIKEESMTENMEIILVLLSGITCGACIVIACVSRGIGKRLFGY